MESDGAEEKKRMHSSIEGNSTVALVDGGTGEENGAIKESTVHSVLDMITNLLPHEVCVIFRSVIIVVSSHTCRVGLIPPHMSFS